MRTTAVIIGAGQAGLAMSWWLAARSIDHVVLERGEVANTWRTERWPSLTLLTPNWQSRLPGFGYEGDDPEGFRTLPETIAFLERYARLVSPRLRTHCRVTSVRRTVDGYEVATAQGTWDCKAVVLATGGFNIAQRPKVSEAVPPGVAQLTPDQYRNPESLQPGGVLVVGAAATGAQLADEIQRAGRPVTLAVGEHVRASPDVPRQGHAVVDGCRRPERRTLRRGREPHPRAQPALVPARGPSGPPQHRSERAHVARGEARRPAGRHSGRQGPALGIVAQRVRTRRPQAESAAEPDRRVGRGKRREMAIRRIAPNRRASKHRRRSDSISIVPGSARSSGRPGFARTTPGWTYRSSTARATSATTAAS